MGPTVGTLKDGVLQRGLSASGGQSRTGVGRLKAHVASLLVHSWSVQMDSQAASSDSWENWCPAQSRNHTVFSRSDRANELDAPRSPWSRRLSDRYHSYRAAFLACDTLDNEDGVPAPLVHRPDGSHAILPEKRTQYLS